MIGRALLLNMANSKKMESLVRNNRISSRSAARFVAGETIESVTEPVRALNRQGIRVSLDFLGESVTTSQEVETTLATYQALLKHINADSLDANISLKLTALGLDIEEALCYGNMQRLLHAAGPDQFIRIDMEGSAYTQRTLDLFYKLWNEGGHRNVGVVIQSYLRRSAADIEELVRLGARVRLCVRPYR